MPDRLRCVGAVDTIDRGAEIKRPSAHRIAGAARHETRQIRLALDHFRRRRPVGPFLLTRNAQEALPLEAVTANADAVTQGDIVRPNEIEKSIRRIDDDCARRLAGPVEYRLVQ